MNSTGAAQGGPDQAEHYEIRLLGHMEARCSDQFAELTLRRESEGTTLIAGPVVDQAALHGLLQRVLDTGLPLISMRSLGPIDAPT